MGLGTGSTAAFAVARLGELLKAGTLKNIIGVPTSIATQKQAEGEGRETKGESVPGLDRILPRGAGCRIRDDGGPPARRGNSRRRTWVVAMSRFTTQPA